jgi:hypothetical protein
MRFRAVCAVLILVLAAACSRSSEPPRDIAQAVAVVGYLASEKFMNRSAYTATGEDLSPTEFVSYLFSDIGAAELPEPARPGDPVGEGRGGPPTWPAGVALRPLRPDRREGRQVVVIPDDSRNVIIAEGYLSAMTPPVVRREFVLAKPRGR